MATQSDYDQGLDLSLFSIFHSSWFSLKKYCLQALFYFLLCHWTAFNNISLQCSWVTPFDLMPAGIQLHQASRLMHITGGTWNISLIGVAYIRIHSHNSGACNVVEWCGLFRDLNIFVHSTPFPVSTLKRIANYLTFLLFSLRHFQPVLKTKFPLLLFSWGTSTNQYF